MNVTPEQRRALDRMFENWKQSDEGKKVTELKKKNANIVSVDDENVAVNYPTNEFVKQLAQKNKQLHEEKEDLESRLTIIAEKEFNRRKAIAEQEASKIGLNVSIEDPNELKAIEKTLRENEPSNHTGNRDIPLSSQYRKQTSNVNNSGVSPRNRSYESQDEMFDDLKALEKEGDKEATRILQDLTKKAVKDLVSGNSYEFTGSLKKAKIDDKETKKWKKV